MTAMADALQKAGYDTSGDEVYALVSQMRAQGRSLREIEDAVWKRCQRRPVLFGPVIAAYVDRIDADMQFRRKPDGAGQKPSTNEGHQPPASADSSGGDTGGDHHNGASNGHMEAVPEFSSGNAGQEAGAGQGQDANAPSTGETSREDQGQSVSAEKASEELPTSREDLTEAARTLRQERERLRHQPGAGAMQPRAYETRARVFGESWLLTYAIPDGPRLLSLRAGEVRPMMQRMAREGAARAHAWVLLKAVADELDALGQVHEDMKIESILMPATVARLADAYTPDIVMAKARAHFNSFPKLENTGV